MKTVGKYWLYNCYFYFLVFYSSEGIQPVEFIPDEIKISCVIIYRLNIFTVEHASFTTTIVVIIF